MEQRKEVKDALDHQEQNYYSRCTEHRPRFCQHPIIWHTASTTLSLSLFGCFERSPSARLTSFPYDAFLSARYLRGRNATQSGGRACPFAIAFLISLSLSLFPCATHSHTHTASSTLPLALYTSSVEDLRIKEEKATDRSLKGTESSAWQPRQHTRVGHGNYNPTPYYANGRSRGCRSVKSKDKGGREKHGAGGRKERERERESKERGE